MPPAISGKGGHNATFDVAVAVVHGFDLTEEQALPILRKYNERCEPPWTEKELRHKLADASKLTHHSEPRGYLRDRVNPEAGEPAKQAIPAKPLRLRAASWQDRIAELKEPPPSVTDEDPLGKATVPAPAPTSPAPTISPRDADTRPCTPEMSPLPQNTAEQNTTDHMRKSQITLFESASNPDCKIHHTSIATALDGIKSGKWKNHADKVRHLSARYGRDSEQVKKAQLEAPIMTLSGVFSALKPDALEKHSGHITLVLREVSDIPGTRKKLESSPHIRGLWASSNGTELVVVVPLSDTPADDARHKRAHAAAVTAIEGSTGFDLASLGLDDGTQDIAHAISVSYDPDLHSNADAKPVEWKQPVKDDEPGRHPPWHQAR